MLFSLSLEPRGSTRRRDDAANGSHLHAGRWPLEKKDTATSADRFDVEAAGCIIGTENWQGEVPATS